MEAWYYSPCMNDPPTGGSHGRLHRATKILLGGAAVAWPLVARAQQPARVGILTLGGELTNPLFDAFRQEMRRLGYVEGRTLVLEFRSAAGTDRLPELAAELARLPVDVIVVEGTPAARAAKQATSSIPIVMGTVAEPVETGLVTNLARPDGNITGFTGLSPELGTKRLGLSPCVHHVARRRGGDVAVCGAGAAGGDTGNRVPPLRI
jgi:hypothetical protein